MGVIGKTLAMGLAATSIAASSAATCHPDGVSLPGGFACAGASIVNTANNQYYHVTGYQCSGDGAVWPAGVASTQMQAGRICTTSPGYGLVTNSASCPSASQLSAGYSCAFAVYGYVEGPQGNLWVVDNGALVRLSIGVDNTIPDGFTYKDATTLTGPGLNEWGVGADRFLYRLQAQVVGCPQDRLPAGFNCQDGFDNLVRSTDGWHIIVGEELQDLVINGDVAPAGFDWVVPFTVIKDPNDSLWSVGVNGGLGPYNGNIVTPTTCNNGRPLQAGLRCAPGNNGYILDQDDEFFTLNSAGQIVRLTIVDNAAPQGFTVLPDGKTLQGPQGPGFVYSVNPETLVLEYINSSAEVHAKCPEERLPVGYTCAEASTQVLGGGSDAGLFGYVLDNGNSGVKNYYVIAGNTLVPLASEDGAVPAGFTVLPTQEGEKVCLQGPDATVQNYYEFQSNGVLAGISQGECNTQNTVGEDCATQADRLPQYYSCATNGGQVYNYVMGPGSNYYYVKEGQLFRLKVQDNVAPAGFTVQSANPPTLNGPELNGLTYTLDAEFNLVASNPETSGDQLVSDSCPKSRLPSNYQCPATGKGFGYVLGRLTSSGDFKEYFVIEGNSLKRLAVVDNQAPAGFTILPDKQTLRGPVVNNYVYSVGAGGILQAETAPASGPTIGYWCEDGRLPDGTDSPPLGSSGEVKFTCANSQLPPPEWCGNDWENTAEETQLCFNADARYQRGIIGVTNLDIDGILENIPEAYGYMLDPNKNYYVLAGRNIVRLTINEEGDIPEGFAYVAGSTNLLVGPDAEATSFGFQYTVDNDGVLVASGGSTPLPTIYRDVCPAERLPAGYSCVEDYTGPKAFGFYIRDDESSNLFSISSDGEHLVQTSLGGNLQVAPRGFEFDTTDTTSNTLFGPLGWVFTRNAGSGKLAYSADAAGNAEPIQVSPFGGPLSERVADYGCDEQAVIVDDDDNVVAGLAFNVAEELCHTPTNAKGYNPTNAEYIISSSDPLSTWVPADLEVGATHYEVIYDGHRVPVGSLGTPNNPQVPKGWNPITNAEGQYQDPSGNLYTFVYAHANGFTAQVVYL